MEDSLPSAPFRSSIPEDEDAKSPCDRVTAVQTVQRQDQIIRFGGQTDPSLPWPEKNEDNDQSQDKRLRLYSSRQASGRRGWMIGSAL